MMLCAGLADPAIGGLGPLAQPAPYGQHLDPGRHGLAPYGVPALVAHRLEELGIEAVDVSGSSTYVPASIRSSWISASAIQVPRWATRSLTLQSGSRK